MSEKKTDIGNPIGQPSIWLISVLFAEKTHSAVNLFNSFPKTDFLQNGFNTFLT